MSSTRSHVVETIVRAPTDVFEVAVSSSVYLLVDLLQEGGLVIREGYWQSELLRCDEFGRPLLPGTEFELESSNDPGRKVAKVLVCRKLFQVSPELLWEHILTVKAKESIWFPEGIEEVDYETRIYVARKVSTEVQEGIACSS